MKLCSAGAEPPYADRQRNDMKLTVAFRKFATRPEMNDLMWR
jgi:hypothetical protein